MSDTQATSVINAPNESGETSTAVIGDTIARLQQNRSTVYSTVQGDDFETKLKVLSAVTSAVSIRDSMDKGGLHVNLENIVVQPVEVTDRSTGEVTTQPRVILLDADGTAYYGISPVMLRAIETFTGVLGQPSTWPGPLPVKITEGKSGNGYRFYNMTLDPTPKK